MRTLISLSILVILAVLAAPGCTTGTEPGQPQQAAGEGTSGEAENSAYETVPEIAAPAQLWQYTTGGEIWSTPVIHEGLIFLASDDGNIYALDRVSGEQKWQFATGGIVRSQGAVCGQSVLFASDDGNLYALDGGSGVEVWRFDLGSADVSRRLPATGPPYDYDYLSSSPVCVSGMVYVGSADSHLYAVDAATGVEKWRFKTGDRIRSTPLVHQGQIYVGSWDQHVYALDADSSEEIWKFDTGGIIQASPAHGDGKIFIGSRNPKVFALDAETGAPVWEYVHEDQSWVESSAVFAAGTVYIGTSDALVLQALDPATGEELWRYRTGGWSWCTPLVAEDTVYIGAISAHPYYFEGVTLERGVHAVDRRTGTKRWSVATGELSGGYITGGVHASPVMAHGVLYVAALDGDLYAMK